MGVILGAGCSFAPPPLGDEPSDAAVDAMPDSVPDARIRVSACANFEVVGDSSYLLLPGTIVLNWVDAFQHCPMLDGAHLATFETREESAKVLVGLPLTSAAWTGVAQINNATTANEGWFNRIGSTTTPIPSSFPWGAGEPNDYSLPENNEENAAELRADGNFNDRPLTHMNRVLCECQLAP